MKSLLYTVRYGNAEVAQCQELTVDLLLIVRAMMVYGTTAGSLPRRVSSFPRTGVPQ